MPYFSEQAILEGLKTGTKVEAITQYLYQAYYGAIRNQVRRYGGNEADCEDVFQDTLLVFIEVVAESRFEPGKSASLKTYLTAIASRLWNKNRQRQEKQGAWEEGYSAIYTQIEPILERYEVRMTAIQLLDQLDKSCREVLEAYYLDDLPIKDIAEKLNLDESAVKQRKFRCLQKLKERFNR